MCGSSTAEYGCERYRFRIIIQVLCNRLKMDSLSRNDLIKTIERYQHNISLVNPPERDPQRVLHYIRKLSKLPIRLEELEKTGVGKTINALRKCEGTVGDEAGILVGKWKAIAKQQVNEEEEAALDKQNDADSHSDYESPSNECKSSVSKSSKKSKTSVAKVQVEKQVKEIKLKTLKDKVHSSKDSTNDRKRKHSLDKDKHERKEKYVKLESASGSEDENCLNERRVKSDSARKSIKTEDKHRDNDRKKKKDKQCEDKADNKDLDKKHHKSSKHKDDKNHHRHHSAKSSHTEKKRDSKSDPEKYRGHADKKKDSSKSKHDSERKSSNSSRKESKSSSKYSSNGPKTSHINNRNSDSDDYDDLPVNNTDDDFGATLLGISQAVSPVKKKSTPSKYSSSIQSSPATNSPVNSGGSDFDVLSSSVKLEPLDDIDLEKLKEDNYRSKDEYTREKSTLRLKELSEEQALNSMTTTKNQRTKVFSGGKSRYGVKVPTLFELCVRILQDNFDSLEYTGGVPYDVLKPILEKVTVEQLYTFENYNPYLIGETDELWEYHAKRHFRQAKRLELETWRDVYLRCVEEREEKLQSLTENISQSIANSAPVRKTMLTNETQVKPPRNVARSQAKHGTGHITVKRSPKGPQPSPAAVQSVKERLAQESLAAPQAVSLASSKNQMIKKKKAPLMQKTLQIYRGLKRL